ncbi:hypothetical protein ACLESD_20640, partial [Pyxidicoccus sp. 3LFB2]
MRRLLALAIPLALMMGTGCVAHVHDGHYRSHRSVEVIEYSYSGDHPVPDDHGGGWCSHTHTHVHEYQPTTTYYVYTDNAYYYRGPSLVWYWDYHPHAHGGHCNLSGRHSHDYYPTASRGYRYERNRGYVWDRTHTASPVYGYAGRASRPSSRPSSYSTNDNGGSSYGRRPPPSGTGHGTTPPRSDGGWGNGGNSGNGSSGGGYGNGNSGNGNSGGGYGTPPAGRGNSNGRGNSDDKDGLTLATGLVVDDAIVVIE